MAGAAEPKSAFNNAAPLAQSAADEVQRLRTDPQGGPHPPTPLTALRVLAMAYKEISGPDLSTANEDELTFAGLIGMLDPSRDEAIQAVDICRAADIRTVMITGDRRLKRR